MRIRMKVTLSGTRNGEDWPPAGEIADIPTGEAQHLVASGIAEEVTAKDQTPEVETAAAPDTAEKRPARKAPTQKPAKD
ncbi:hypothetical protein ACIPJM_00650 [Streptomyces halstedii]|uniref:hypothetical protein n=1 Tax=Streptomyces halstedii TaxID=1944 RepID=UPI0038088BC7